MDPYRSGRQRPVPYSGLESIHLTNTVPPFRTVPTSITITPSKQQRNPTNNPLPKTENTLIPPGPQTLPPANPEVPVLIRDRPLPPQPSPAQVKFNSISKFECILKSEILCFVLSTLQELQKSKLLLRRSLSSRQKDHFTYHAMQR